MAKVSIIMPSYNVSKYIGACIESVIKQTLEDIEIIIVDKYSTDGTREIIESYRNRDSRIRLLNDDRGSCGYSNNKGIQQATGKYIGIVETDDYVDAKMFKTLFDLAERNNLDYIKSDFWEFVTNTSGKEISKEHRLLFDYMERHYNECIFSNDYPELPWFDCCMWNGIYKREYLIENQVRFNESPGAAYQDHGFLWQAIGYAKKVMYIDRAFYHYRTDNEASSMNNPRALEMDFGELRFIHGHLNGLAERNSSYPWVFYKKTLLILEERLRQFLMGGGTLSSDMLEQIDGYRKLLLSGISENHFRFCELNRKTVQNLLILENSLEQYVEVIKQDTQAEKILKESLFKIVKESQETVLFGCGQNGQRLYWLFIKENVDNKIAAFSDNDEKKWGMNLFDKEVLPPEQAIKRFHNATYLIANERHCYDLQRQLLEHGIKKDKIFICRYGLA